MLQRYRGELTLMDSRSSGGMDEGRDDGRSFDRSSGGGSFGRSSPMDQRAPAAGGSISEAIDDDIPF